MSRADVVELVDTRALGARASGRESSSLSVGTNTLRKGFCVVGETRTGGGRGDRPIETRIGSFWYTWKENNRHFMIYAREKRVSYP